MMDISKIDSNFRVETTIDKKDIQFYNIEDQPFKIYGVFKENGKYRRMSEDVAQKVSERVYALHTNTAGGRVRFTTDSQYVAIFAKMGAVKKSSHFALAGSIGLDLYADNRYIKSYIPPFDIEDYYESIIEFSDKAQREITINLPLYSDVHELHIGLQNDALLKAPTPYKNKKPVVFYGSSITQGACASRPGMSYEAILSRTFGFDYLNLGFSGGAHAEDEIIEYIKNLDMSAFVYDYDYNAPSAEHLKNTHEKMFMSIREKHPLIPIIIMSRPKHFLTQEEEVRRKIIETTYLHAIEKGDKNVYFLDGEKLTALCKDSGTVDNAHPTDFGFASIANALSDVISILINKIEE